MTDTKRGFIYKLYSQINETYYIGSTRQELRKRFYGHKHGIQKVNKKVEEWIDDIGQENLKIITLNEFKEISIKDLKIEEDKVVREHLGNEHCLNCNRAYRTNKEREEHMKKYYENNKEKIAEQIKVYRENNKEKVKETERKYRENNKEKVAERMKKYYENNKEKILEQKKKQFYCICCNTTLNSNHMSRHNNTLTHIKNFIEY